MQLEHEFRDKNRRLETFDIFNRWQNNIETLSMFYNVLLEYDRGGGNSAGNHYFINF